MGFVKRFFEEQIREYSFGLSDKVGITGVDGAVHDNSKAVSMGADNIYFNEPKLKIGKRDIVSITCEEENSAILGDNTQYGFDLRGGLTVYIQKCDINSSRDWLDASFYGVLAKKLDALNFGGCTHIPIGKLDISDFSPSNTPKLACAISDVLWAVDIADKIRGIDGIVVNEIYLLFNCFLAYKTLWNASDAYFHAIENSEDCDAGEVGKSLECFPDMSQIMPTLINAIKRQLKYIDSDEECVKELVAEIFANSRVSCNTVDDQVKKYDNLRNARAFGYTEIGDEILATLLSKDGGCKPFGDEQWATHRKMIVCTDDKAALTTWQDGLQVPNVMVMDAQDIIAYNDAVEKDMRLTFELGHPQNGMTYVQHPMQQNVYIDLDSFHSSLLEQKYEEFKKILKALGAVYITCKVTNSDSTDEKQRRKMTGGVEGNIPVGEVSSKFEHSGVSSKKSDIYKELETEIRNLTPKTKPYLPDGLIFYPFEASWKNLAESALNGTIKEEETTLTYRKDYAVTGQNLKSIEIKLKSLVPGYQFGVGGSFAHEIESELKQLKSTVWHYHVIFENEAGERAGANNATASTASAVPANTDANKVELLFAKRAKRYAQSEGHINAEQRADLEAFAQKYGIDEFRMEELIEEAFV